MLMFKWRRSVRFISEMLFCYIREDVGDSLCINVFFGASPFDEDVFVVQSPLFKCGRQNSRKKDEQFRNCWSVYYGVTHSGHMHIVSCFEFSHISFVTITTHVECKTHTHTHNWKTWMDKYDEVRSWRLCLSALGVRDGCKGDYCTYKLAVSCIQHIRAWTDIKICLAQERSVWLHAFRD